MKWFNLVMGIVQGILGTVLVFWTLFSDVDGIERLVYFGASMGWLAVADLNMKDFLKHA